MLLIDSRRTEGPKKAEVCLTLCYVIEVGCTLGNGMCIVVFVVVLLLFLLLFCCCCYFVVAVFVFVVVDFIVAVLKL